MTAVSEVMPSAHAAVLAVLMASFSIGKMLGPHFSAALYQISFRLVCAPPRF
jgi:hypothetical protein